MSLDVDLIINDTSYHEFNITHNLGDMADAAGLYKAMWRPEELFDDGDFKAKDIIPYLRSGVEELERPERQTEFLALAPDNGWGTFDGLLEIAKAYLVACENLPHATISVWR